MALGLGIDTGGTYTDAVIYDFDANKVLSRAKMLTTHADYSLGIESALKELPEDLRREVTLCSLSTTLATNACVEGRGSRAVLILLGYDERIMSRVGDEYGLKDAQIIYINGSHTQFGGVKEAPDYAAVEAAVRDIMHDVQAIGICEYWGIRNSGFERKAKEIAREIADLPVVAAHELTNEPNSLRRAASTLINARLIALTEELLDAVKLALNRQAITAPLMVVRGDGSLMSESFAREYPVETLLSGPAASVMGAMRLCDAKDVIAIDIGGTTTDIAIVRGGRASLAKDGVDIGHFRTGTHAIAIRTVGLGGDSRISFDRDLRLTVGPQRALPLCRLAIQHPHIIDEMSLMFDEELPRTYSRGEFFVLHKEPGDEPLSGMEKRIVDCLKNGAMSVDNLARAVGTRAYFLDTAHLEYRGIILRAALTPTDVMHVSGQYCVFDVRASELGVKLLAQRLFMRQKALIKAINDQIGHKLHEIISGYLLKRALKKEAVVGDAGRLAYLPIGDEIDVRFNVNIPLAALGAPGSIMLKTAAERLNAPMLTPNDAAVANAVGAITGSITCEECVTIKPHYAPQGLTGFSAHASRGYFEAETLYEIETWARETAERLVRERGREMGAAALEISLESSASIGAAAGDEEESLLLEKTVVARGIGKTALY